MRGIAYCLTGGKAADLDEVLMPNVFQELFLVHGCTSFAAFGPAAADGRLVHGRNLDYSGIEDLARHGLVAVHEPTCGHSFITLTFPTHTGIMHGMNDQGISVSMNYSLAKPEHMTLDGIPFTFLLRQVVQYAGTLDEAMEGDGVGDAASRPPLRPAANRGTGDGWL